MAKILIVDDDPETTSLLKGIVAAKGHLPTTVNSSISAVEVANNIVPDLILMDILMPDINGIQLTKIFQATPNLKHIPIIIISALADIGSKRDAFNAGAKDFMTKPVRPDELATKIKTLVDEISHGYTI